MGWAVNRIPYCSSNANGCAWLGVSYGVGRLAVGLKKTHSRPSTAVRTCMKVDRARVISITRACLRLQVSARAKGV